MYIGYLGIFIQYIRWRDPMSRHLNIKWMYVHCRKICHLLVPAVETGKKENIRRAFVFWFAASVNEFYNFRQWTYIVPYPSLSSSPNGLKRAEASVVLTVCMVSSVESVLILLQFLTVAGHGSCTRTKQHTFNVTWLLE